MSVAEPPVTTNSSSPPQSNVSESSTPSYAFLVHSQKTLTQNLPPRVDNKLLARQKRRRTSPEDHAILEAEYQKNPKPDKAARASIVSRVALGEKEVQIWFQNRRQNDRRKSKPLQPHELVAPRATMNNSTAQNGNDNGTKELQSSSGSDQSDEHEHAISEGDNKDIDSSSKADADCGAQSGDNGNVESSQSNVELASSQKGHSQQEDMNNVQFGLEREKIEGSCPQLNSRKRPFSNMHEEKFDQKGPDANGRVHANDLKSPPSLRISMSFDGEAMVRREGELTPSPPKARTAVRISMSSDGEALIRTEDEPSPSKNRMRLFSSRPPRLPGLRRSTSAINFPVSRPGFLEGDSKPFGRSRDSRTWELYCDTDARSALSTPSSSQSVSTSGTSGLYRRRRSLTRSSFSRPNILTPRPGLLNQGTPVEGSGEKRRKLSRAVSSLGRLESSQKVDAFQQPVKQGLSTSGSFKESEEDLEWQLGDSDKENWVPGTQMSNPRRSRRGASQMRRSVLREAGMSNNNTVDDGKRERALRTLRDNANKQNEIKLPSKLDDEVKAFMSESGASSREEDLDCIQGLLSLSQGAWR